MNVLVSILLEIFWFLWIRTIRCQIQGLELVDEERSRALVPVFAVPHHSLLLSVLSYRKRSATVLASLSSDGELAARFLRKRGFKLVRGSSSRGGKEALAELKSAIGLGEPVAVTFDGPRGPRLVPKAGVAVCAWHASGSLFVVNVRVLPSLFYRDGLCVRLNSWDRFVVPLPFCRMQVVYERLLLPSKDSCSMEEWVNHALRDIQSSVEKFETNEFEATDERCEASNNNRRPSVTKSR